MTFSALMSHQISKRTPRWFLGTGWPSSVSGSVRAALYMLVFQRRSFHNTPLPSPLPSPLQLHGKLQQSRRRWVSVGVAVARRPRWEMGLVADRSASFPCTAIQGRRNSSPARRLAPGSMKPTDDSRTDLTRSSRSTTRSSTSHSYSYVPSRLLCLKREARHQEVANLISFISSLRCSLWSPRPS